MGEGRAGDGLIKLFGKTIPVPETAAVGEAAKVRLVSLLPPPNISLSQAQATFELERTVGVSACLDIASDQGNQNFFSHLLGLGSIVRGSWFFCCPVAPSGFM